jgi:hypothetical protein
MRYLLSRDRATAIVVMLVVGLLMPLPHALHAQKPLAALAPITEAHFTNGSIGHQLGAKVSDRADVPLALGASVTGLLQDPSALERFGIKGMHKGARVAAMRFAPDKIRVEVDEVVPTPKKAATTLRVNEAGELSMP